MQDFRNRAFAGQSFHPIMEDYPLIVPGDDPARLGEEIRRRVSLLGQHLANRIVKFEESEIGVGDQQVLIVAMIGDQCEALGAAWQIIAEIAGHVAEGNRDVLADQQLWSRLIEFCGISRIEMWTAIRPQAIDTIKLDTWRPEILNSERIHRLVAQRCEIQCDVVINELAEIGKACRNTRIVSGRTARIGVGSVLRRQGL